MSQSQYSVPIDNQLSQIDINLWDAIRVGSEPDPHFINCRQIPCIKLALNSFCQPGLDIALMSEAEQFYR